jgi:hypothetical protein
MILTIENIENYTSYYCLKLRNFSSSSASCYVYGFRYRK